MKKTLFMAFALSATLTNAASIQTTFTEDEALSAVYSPSNGTYNYTVESTNFWRPGYWTNWDAVVAVEVAGTSDPVITNWVWYSTNLYVDGCQVTQNVWRINTRYTSAEVLSKVVTSWVYSGGTTYALRVNIPYADMTNTFGDITAATNAAYIAGVAYTDGATGGCLQASESVDFAGAAGVWYSPDASASNTYMSSTIPGLSFTTDITATGADFTSMPTSSDTPDGSDATELVNVEYCADYLDKTGDTITGGLVISNNTLTLLYKVTPTFATNGIKITGGTYDSADMTSVFVEEDDDYASSGYTSWTNTIGGTLLRIYCSATLGPMYYIHAGGDAGNSSVGFTTHKTEPIGSYTDAGGALYDGSPVGTYDVTTNDWNTVYTNAISSTASGQLQLNSIDFYDYISLTNKLKLDGVY
jgi:hypothetical protein